MIAVIALVAFIYCGGSRVPPVLRQNKDMILGVLVGLVLCSFFGLRLEGALLWQNPFVIPPPARPSECICKSKKTHHIMDVSIANI